MIARLYEEYFFFDIIRSLFSATVHLEYLFCFLLFNNISITTANLLDMFLERNAITKSDYEKSLGNLTRKMGMEQLLQTLSANKGGHC